MERWDYKVVAWPPEEGVPGDEPEALQGHLGELGRQGFELAGVVPRDRGSLLVLRKALPSGGADYRRENRDYLLREL